MERRAHGGQKPYWLSIETLLAFDPMARENVAYLNSLNLLAIGVTPYTRIIPSFFLTDYTIYSATAPTDVAVMRTQARVYTLAEKHPDVARKVHATSYLIGNHHFQGFVRSLQKKPTILISSPTHAVKQKLAELGLNYIATESDIVEGIKTKRAFREVLDTLGIPALGKKYIARTEFLSMDWEVFVEACYPRAVIQRADKEVGGNKGTFFILDQEAFRTAQQALRDEALTESLLVSPFVQGPSVSMLGCVTSQGTVSGSLQLQFIDVPEALHGVSPNGIFFGNDWGYHAWPERVDDDASAIVEKIGNYLGSLGYRGIFGIDFMLDQMTDTLYPLECNPRITGSSPVFSLMLLAKNVPPIEYYHLLALTGRDSSIDMERANKGLKERRPCAHVSISPKQITKMTLPLQAGVYNYDHEAQILEYRGPGFHLLDLKHANDFLLIDTIPQMGEVVHQDVPGFFKFIFNHQIGISSVQVQCRVAAMLERFSSAILAGQTKDPEVIDTEQ